jgi:hypothetical protein
MHYIDGVLRYWEDDVARLSFVYDETGAQIDGLAYTPEQNALADERAAILAEQAAFEALRLAVKDVITDVKSYKDTLDAAFTNPDGTSASNAQIASAPGKYVKANQRAIERTMRAVLDLAKLVDGRV